LTGRVGSELGDRGHTVGASTQPGQDVTRRRALYVAWWVLHHIPPDLPASPDAQKAGLDTAQVEVLAELLDELGLNGRPIRSTRTVTAARRRQQKQRPT
jgi:hypothetical protein